MPPKKYLYLAFVLYSMLKTCLVQLYIIHGVHRAYAVADVGRKVILNTGGSPAVPN